MIANENSPAGVICGFKMIIVFTTNRSPAPAKASGISRRAGGRSGNCRHENETWAEKPGLVERMFDVNW